ncbi:MAG TPA: S1 RNA-binding domain-containing protein, partial [Bryobacteraceae bacterium]|nr:S1 RNA-binding domain-containing protein [Bryobacteraceae bacterium]
MADNETAGPSEPPVTAVDPEEYQHLLEDYSHLAPPARHEVLEGRVLKISGGDVFIDVGYKADGVAPLAEFTDSGGNPAVQPGDLVQVMVESGQSSEGYVILSHEKAARLRVWDNLENA